MCKVKLQCCLTALDRNTGVTSCACITSPMRVPHPAKRAAHVLTAPAAAGWTARSPKRSEETIILTFCFPAVPAAVPDDRAGEVARALGGATLTAPVLDCRHGKPTGTASLRLQLCCILPGQTWSTHRGPPHPTGTKRSPSGPLAARMSLNVWVPETPGQDPLHCGALHNDTVTVTVAVRQ